MEFHEPAATNTGSSESGTEKSGSGAPAPRDTANDLFNVVLVLHFFAVIVVLFNVGINFGALWVSIVFVLVTLGWIAWIRKYQRDQEQRAISRAFEEQRRARAQFTDPRQ